MNAHHQIKNLATKHSLIKKMEALLKITAPEAKQVIDQDKLKHKVSQESIWKHFGLTAHQYSQVPTGENATMVKTAVVFNLIENLHHERGKQLWSVAYSSHSSQFYSFFKLFTWLCFKMDSLMKTWKFWLDLNLSLNL